MTEIRVPTLGESVTEATVGQWMKKEGDSVALDETILELETDKVSVTVSAPSSGVLTNIAAQEGDTVELDALLGKIEEGAGKAPSAPAAAATNGASAPEADAESTTIEIVAPASGESVSEADIGEWFVKVGDVVTVDSPIVSLETDKAAVDVSAPASGTITEIRAAEGDTVTVGAVLALMVTGDAPVAKSAPAAAAPAPSVAKPTPGAQISPAPQRVIAQNNLDASQIPGTGKGGRITKGDALAYVQSGAATKAPVAAKPAVSRELGEREERVKMSRLRQTIARRLKESQENAAMLTTFNDVDMTAVMDVRKQYKDLFEKKHGVKLGFMSFFIKACVHALREIPDVNAEIDGTDIIYKDHYDVGVAVGTDKGLVVPVLRDADMKSIAQIEAEIVDFGKRGRTGDLTMAEMQGGTFTITNGGVYGSLMSTPILNMPQSGILGMHRIEKRPVVVGDQIVIRPMMYLALSYDHRIVDGKGAVTFLVRVKENLEDPQRLLLDL